MPPSVLYGLADLLRQCWRCLRSGAVFGAVAGQSDGTLESVGFLVRDIYVPTWGLLPSAHGAPMASPPTENSPRSLCLGTPPGFPGPLCVRRGCSSSTSHLSPTAHCSFISQTWTLRSSRAHVAVGAWLSPLSPETVKAPTWDLCPAFGGTQSPKWSLMSCWHCWINEWLYTTAAHPRALVDPDEEAGSFWALEPSGMDIWTEYTGEFRIWILVAPLGGFQCVFIFHCSWMSPAPMMRSRCREMWATCTWLAAGREGVLPCWADGARKFPSSSQAALICPRVLF